MGDDDGSVLWCLETIDTFGYNAQRIDIQT